MTQSSAWSADCFLDRYGRCKIFPSAPVKTLITVCATLYHNYRSLIWSWRTSNFKPFMLFTVGKTFLFFFTHRLWQKYLLSVSPFPYRPQEQFMWWPKVVCCCGITTHSLMVDQVRALRRNGVSAVVISSTSRESSIVHEYLAADKSLMSSSIIFTSPEALNGEKSWKTLLCLVMCVRLWLMKPTVCLNGDILKSVIIL